MHSPATWIPRWPCQDVRFIKKCWHLATTSASFEHVLGNEHLHTRQMGISREKAVDAAKVMLPNQRTCQPGWARKGIKSSRIVKSHVTFCTMFSQLCQVFSFSLLNFAQVLLRVNERVWECSYSTCIYEVRIYTKTLEWLVRNATATCHDKKRQRVNTRVLMAHKDSTTVAWHNLKTTFSPDSLPTPSFPGTPLNVRKPKRCKTSERQERQGLSIHCSQ